VQCFALEACLRLVLLPLYKTAYLAREPDWSTFASASPVVSTFFAVVDDHARVDFRPLQGFNHDWESATTIDLDQVRMATAALIHFDGDVADLARWIGGVPCWRTTRYPCHTILPPWQDIIALMQH
jgi:hypothetical protein